MTFGPVMPRLDAEWTAGLLRNCGCDVPECDDDDEATTYFGGSGNLQGGEHYLRSGDEKQLRVYVDGAWIRQVTLRAC